MLTFKTPQKETEVTLSLELECPLQRCYASVSMVTEYTQDVSQVYPQPELVGKEPLIFMVNQDTLDRSCHMLYKFLIDCRELSYWAENQLMETHR